MLCLLRNSRAFSGEFLISSVNSRILRTSLLISIAVIYICSCTAYIYTACGLFIQGCFHPILCLNRPGSTFALTFALTCRIQRRVALTTLITESDSVSSLSPQSNFGDAGRTHRIAARYKLFGLIVGGIFSAISLPRFEEEPNRVGGFPRLSHHRTCLLWHTAVSAK